MREGSCEIVRFTLIKVYYCDSLDVSSPGIKVLWQIFPLIMFDSFMVYLCDFVFGMLAPNLEIFCLSFFFIEEFDCPVFHPLLLHPLQSLCNSFEISAHIYLP